MDRIPNKRTCAAMEWRPWKVEPMMSHPFTLSLGADADRSLL